MALAKQGGSSSASALDKGQNRSGIKPVETKDAGASMVEQAHNHGGTGGNKKLPK